MGQRAVIFGGPSPEHDISVSTGLQATHVLGDVIAIYWDKRGGFHQVDPKAEAVEFADGPPPKAKAITFRAEAGGGFYVKKRLLDISAVLICCHGGPGEDGTLQGALDLVGLRYSGPGQSGSALGMDKMAFGAVMSALGLPTLPRVLLTEDSPDFAAPYIVKPRFGGSSIGIEVVEDHATALALRHTPVMADGAVLEPYIADCRDLQVAIKTYPRLELSAVEEPTRSPSGLYSYEQKYLAWGDGGDIARKLPAPMTGDVAAQIDDMTWTIARAVGLRSVARIDFLERGGAVWVNEVNAIPGSLASYLWIDPPISRLELLEGILSEVEASGPRAFSTHGADGSALRNAGSIASKLG